ncbi:glycosyltransferase family 2 protein [Ruminococcus bicirculans (ex Wegman et al. 2014)]|uniref:Glycosyltransferase family 2 protein n=1 Tax=Ruminococcus bicirculans (ex Wegman et al. 2014) TaxID=1160721 RepID=A0AAW5KSR4_9FIRM|nr:glycosyltransferase family A protein [Ruminococcus bicirculans (ex Wegman et al. 2014)]MCQ5154086.1 glycosyltransferase family 2 protein [Ruminococcus bicirculans (ex Wegman et al. 2014)]
MKVWVLAISKSMDDILLSVVCTAYNHEKYIRDALEGFVSQKTNFKYEVLVHDDASTDNTASIIKEYEHRYPEIIKPIYQQVNQYSKGVRIINDVLVPRAKGKYLAFCEGDDYWCDCNKLQKQVDVLESSQNYVACVHNTNFLYMTSNNEIIKYPTIDRILKLDDCVMCGSQSFHTSSLVVRKSVYQNKPSFTFSVEGVGDYPNSIYYSLCGSIYYIADVMSVYRVGTESSWTKKNERDIPKQIKTVFQVIEMLKQADQYSGYHYHQLFEVALSKKDYLLLIIKKEYRAAIKNDNFKSDSIRNKIKIILYATFPFLPSWKDRLWKIKKK